MSEQLSLHSATFLTKSLSLTEGKTTQSINDLQGQRRPCDWARVLRQGPGEAVGLGKGLDLVEEVFGKGEEQAECLAFLS